jgi:hypothetical protein
MDCLFYKIVGCFEFRPKGRFGHMMMHVVKQICRHRFSHLNQYHLQSSGFFRPLYQHVTPKHCIYRPLH